MGTNKDVTNRELQLNLRKMLHAGQLSKGQLKFPEFYLSTEQSWGKGLGIFLIVPTFLKLENPTRRIS